MLNVVVKWEGKNGFGDAAVFPLRLFGVTTLDCTCPDTLTTSSKMLGVYEFLLLIPSLAISLAIIVPLTGILVRFRANYNPKGLQLDAEGGAQPHTGPVIHSYVAMLLRVYRIEVCFKPLVPLGWCLYICRAGLVFTRDLVSCTFPTMQCWPKLICVCAVPTLVSSLVISSFILIFLDAPSPRHGAYKVPIAGILVGHLFQFPRLLINWFWNVQGTLVYSFLMMLISLPTAILTYRQVMHYFKLIIRIWQRITNRAITTPHKLTYFSLAQGFHTLLTSTERRKPWILYLTPGLLAAEISHIAIVILIMGPLHRLLLPALGQSQTSMEDISLFKLSLYIIAVMLCTVVLTPLEVIATRLAIQRNHSSADYNPTNQETEEAIEYAGANEDVIG